MIEIQKKTLKAERNEIDLTPKERLLLNKLRKADEEARRVSLMAKENYEERILRDSVRREATFSASARNKSAGAHARLWPKREDEDDEANTDEYVRRIRMQVKTSQHYLPQSYMNFNARADFDFERKFNRKFESNESNDSHEENESDDDGTILKTVQDFKNRTSDAKMPKSDDRPIAPLKTNIQSTSFNEDGIPMDPELTDEYYKNFTEEFEDDDDSNEKKFVPKVSRKMTRERSTIKSLSKTIMPSQRHDFLNKKNELRGSKNKTIGAYGDRSQREEFQLIDHMKNRLHLNDKVAEAFGDDHKNSVFGTSVREAKVRNLRSQAIRALGENLFKKCYEFIKTQRSCKIVDEIKIIDGLKVLASNSKDCFLVDQLIFLEDQRAK